MHILQKHQMSFAEFYTLINDFIISLKMSGLIDEDE